MRSRANTRVNEPTGSPGDDQRSSASEGRARHRGCPDRPCHIRRKQSISSCSTWGEPSRGDESSCVRQVAMSTSSGMRTARCSEANGWAATFGSRGRPGAVAVVARSFDRDAFHTAFVELRLRVRQVCRRTMEAAKLAGDPIPVGFVLVVNARSGPPARRALSCRRPGPKGDLHAVPAPASDTPAAVRAVPSGRARRGCAAPPSSRPRAGAGGRQ